MTYLVYSKLRLRSFLDQAASLAESDFPYADSREALSLVRQRFGARLRQLEHFDGRSNPAVVKHECRLALAALFEYLPLLGFILRSTNVRNAFEAFAPLRRLAATLLNHPVGNPPSIRLLLSSEWDYSPFVYDAIPGLPGFLMIGLPAPESSNPLLLPLAGHELGHCLWRTHKLEDEFQPHVKAAVIGAITSRWEDYKLCFGPIASPEDLTGNLLQLENWAPASDWALEQAEETFCDFVGLLIFGSSFLHAFAYLLSPAFGRRALTYPPLRSRAANLEWVATSVGAEVPSRYEEQFDDEETPTLSRRDRYRLSIADQALQNVREQLLSRAQSLLRRSGLALPSEEEINRVFTSFEAVVPAEGAAGLVTIMNAAWKAFHDQGLWKNLPEVSNQRDSVLRELTLKSLEILEFEHLVKQPQ